MIWAKEVPVDRVGLARWALFLAAGTWACGGGDEGGAPEQGAPAAGESPTEQVAQDTSQAEASSDTIELVREYFTYAGAGRDPFLSLVRERGDVRPFPQDLRLTAIYYDPAFPVRSVAVLRDTTQNRRYEVRVGDVMGRLRVAEVRPREVVITIEEFGQQRQAVLSLRRRQEDMQ
jgi:hypothetical protein